MRKVKLVVEERITYSDEVTVLVPDEMSDHDFNELLDTVEDRVKAYEGGAKDLIDILNELEYETDEIETSFPESPSYSEFDIIDYYED